MDKYSLYEKTIYNQEQNFGLKHKGTLYCLVNNKTKEERRFVIDEKIIGKEYYAMIYDINNSNLSYTTKENCEMPISKMQIISPSIHSYYKYEPSDPLVKTHGAFTKNEILMLTIAANTEWLKSTDDKIRFNELKNELGFRGAVNVYMNQKSHPAWKFYCLPADKLKFFDMCKPIFNLDKFERMDLPVSDCANPNNVCVVLKEDDGKESRYLVGYHDDYRDRKERDGHYVITNHSNLHRSIVGPDEFICMSESELLWRIESMQKELNIVEDALNEKHPTEVSIMLDVFNQKMSIELGLVEPHCDVMRELQRRSMDVAYALMLKPEKYEDFLNAFHNNGTVINHYRFIRGLSDVVEQVDQALEWTKTHRVEQEIKKSLETFRDYIVTAINSDLEELVDREKRGEIELNQTQWNLASAIITARNKYLSDFTKEALPILCQVKDITRNANNPYFNAHDMEKLVRQQTDVLKEKFKHLNVFVNYHNGAGIELSKELEKELNHISQGRVIVTPRLPSEVEYQNEHNLRDRD